MPKCPLCNKETLYLELVEKVIHHYLITHDGESRATDLKSGLTYGDDTPSEPYDRAFSCPECGRNLYTKDEDAARFLGRR